MTKTLHTLFAVRPDADAVHAYQASLLCQFDVLLVCLYFLDIFPVSDSADIRIESLLEIVSSPACLVLSA